MNSFLTKTRKTSSSIFKNLIIKRKFRNAKNSENQGTFKNKSIDKKYENNFKNREFKKPFPSENKSSNFKHSPKRETFKNQEGSSNPKNMFRKLQSYAQKEGKFNQKNNHKFNGKVNRNEFGMSKSVADSYDKIRNSETRNNLTERSSKLSDYKRRRENDFLGLENEEIKKDSSFRTIAFKGNDLGYEKKVIEKKFNVKKEGVKSIEGGRGIYNKRNFPNKPKETKEPIKYPLSFIAHRDNLKTKEKYTRGTNKSTHFKRNSNGNQPQKCSESYTRNKSDTKQFKTGKPITGPYSNNIGKHSFVNKDSKLNRPRFKNETNKKDYKQRKFVGNSGFEYL